VLLLELVLLVQLKALLLLVPQLALQLALAMLRVLHQG
jgi:hypothetical protein